MTRIPIRIRLTLLDSTWAEPGMAGTQTPLWNSIIYFNLISLILWWSQMINIYHKYLSIVWETNFLAHRYRLVSEQFSFTYWFAYDNFSQLNFTLNAILSLDLGLFTTMWEQREHICTYFFFFEKMNQIKQEFSVFMNWEYTQRINNIIALFNLLLLLR